MCRILPSGLPWRHRKKNESRRRGSRRLNATRGWRPDRSSNRRNRAPRRTSRRRPPSPRHDPSRSRRREWTRPGLRRAPGPARGTSRGLRHSQPSASVWGQSRQSVNGPPSCSLAHANRCRTSASEISPVETRAWFDTMKQASKRRRSRASVVTTLGMSTGWPAGSTTVQLCFVRARVPPQSRNRARFAELTARPYHARVRRNHGFTQTSWCRHAPDPRLTFISNLMVRSA